MLYLNYIFQYNCCQRDDGRKRISVLSSVYKIIVDPEARAGRSPPGRGRASMTRKKQRVHPLVRDHGDRISYCWLPQDVLF